MPLEGFTCKKGNVTFKECQQCGECIPRFLSKSIQHITSHDYHQGDVITATSMLGCLRETYLQRKYGYYSPVQSIFYSWRGTLAHSIFETTELSNWLAEERYERELDGIIISGQIDGYDQVIQRLYDIKTIKDVGLSYVIKSGAKDDHIMQASIYRWLCPFPIKDAQIVYISMSGFAVTGQPNTTRIWAKHKPRVTKEGVVSEVIATGKENYQKQKEYIVTYNTPGLKLLSDKEVEDFIKPRAIMLQDAFQRDIIPPRCDEQTRKWKCDAYCSVKDKCDEIEMNRKEVITNDSPRRIHESGKRERARTDEDTQDTSGTHT